MIDVSLARSALEENRYCQELLIFLNGSQKARCGAFADVLLAVEKFVVAFAGRDKVGVDVEFIAFYADLAVDESATARMVGETEGDAWFGRRHVNILSGLVLLQLFHFYVILNV